MDHPIVLDLKRLLCPMPVIKVQNAMKKLVVGERLIAVCTDPGTLHDIPTWCRINGEKVVNIEQNHGEISFLLEKTK